MAATHRVTMLHTAMIYTRHTSQHTYIYPTAFLSFYRLLLLDVSLFILIRYTTVWIFSSDSHFHTLFAFANPAKTSNYTPLQHTHTHQPITECLSALLWPKKKEKHYFT
jgi:hypothetical protein